MRRWFHGRTGVFASVGLALLGSAVLASVYNLAQTGPDRFAVDLELVPVTVATPDRFHRTLNVAKYEVTNAQWDECVDQGGCDHRPKTYPYTRPDHPVSDVNWFDTQQYLTWLSKATGKPYRLPTENEWKLLAADVLAQQDAGKRLFDDPRMEWANEYRFFPQRAPRQTQTAGHFGVSSAGIADLDGNVWEWTASCWNRNDQDTPETTTARCKGWRVLAGTHVTYVPEFIRHVPIGGCSIGYPPANIGFRVVLDEPADLPPLTSLEKG